jgi:hypothetical protein
MSKPDVLPGFDPAHYRWWARPECWQGHCARGFDFHNAGLPRGRHNIGNPNARAVPETPRAEGREPEAVCPTAIFIRVRSPRPRYGRSGCLTLLLMLAVASGVVWAGRALHVSPWLYVPVGGLAAGVVVIRRNA